MIDSLPETVLQENDKIMEPEIILVDSNDEESKEENIQPQEELRAKEQEEEKSSVQEKLPIFDRDLNE